MFKSALGINKNVGNQYILGFLTESVPKIFIGYRLIPVIFDEIGILTETEFKISVIILVLPEPIQFSIPSLGLNLNLYLNFIRKICNRKAKLLLLEDHYFFYCPIIILTCLMNEGIYVYSRSQYFGVIRLYISYVKKYPFDLNQIHFSITSF